MKNKKERLTVQISMKPYLKAFLVSIYGEEPIFFPKRDKVNDLLQLLLKKPPAGYKLKRLDKTNSLEVIIPFFENLNINSYNYLSEKSQKTFVNFVKKRFWVIFEDFMNECSRHDIKKSDAIDLFIEKYQLPDDSNIYDMLLKETYRSQIILKKYPKRRYSFKNTTVKQM